MTVTLEQLKQHLLIEDDTDDEYLLSLIAVAEDAVFKNLNIPDGGELTPVAVQAVLLLAGTLYANRESVSYSSAVKVPHTFDYLIGLDKNYGEGRI